ncbi:MAG: ATP-binding protein [Chthoniobacter sp.]|uniref:ATP-binding response regulator n=1 Tax=Chthoniobacter sp. TaxID=2510640 RepID=UPI0032A5BA65
MSDSIANHPAAEPSLAALDDAPAATVLEPHPIPPRPWHRRIPLVFKLTLLVGVTLAFLVAVMVVANGIFWQNVLRKTVDNHLISVASSRRDMVKAQVVQLRQRSELNTDRGELRGFLYELANGEASRENREGSQQTLDRMLVKPVIGVSLADSSGRVVLSTSPAMVGRDVTSYASFKAGLSDTYFGMPQRDKGRYVAMISAPVRARTAPHRVYGVLLVMNDISELAKALRDPTGLGETGDAILGLREGPQIRFLFPPRNSPKVSAVPVDAAPALKAAAEGREVLMKVPDYRGVPVVAAGQPIGYGGWGLVVKMDAKEAYLPILRVVQLEVLAGIVIMAMGLVAAYVLARRFTRPLRELTQAASRITEGDYETAVPIKSTDEFGTLSANFNEMTTAIRTRRAERDQAEEALRNADRRKDEFLAMLGHELRNPLSAIANAVRLWSVAGDDHGATELARSVIERQTGNLSRLVDDLLDVARITAGKIDLRKHPVDVSEAILRAVEAARPFLDERRHELSLALDSDARIFVNADPTRLEQIITNLLTNAIKYTRKGGELHIDARQEGHEAVIIVSDTGIGITPRMLPHIFELFAQGDRSLDRATGGLGIGLNLCRQLVELHGGTIFASSEGVGRGSTFTVRMPTISVPESTVLPQSPAHRESTGRQRRILLVDDNQDTVVSLARLLSLRGHEVATAFDGVAALKIAQEFQPDFLLLDIGLPGLDGYEVARRLRAGGFARTPIVAISGYAQEGDRIRSREAGFNYHFAKPVDFEALADLILEDPITGD